MDLVKIGFLVTANGLKDANTQVDNLLTKVEKVGNTPIIVKAKLDSSFTAVQKTLTDFSKLKNNITVNILANNNALRSLQDQLSRIKDKSIRVSVRTSTQEIDKFKQSVNKLADKKVKIDIQITPSIQVLQDYNRELDRMRNGNRRIDINPPPVPSGSSGRSSSNLDQALGIAKYALLSAAIYGAMQATLNLISATIKLADEYTSTQQRLKLYIKDAQTLGEVNTFLAKSAIQNNVGLKENAALYAKLAPAMQRIGANTAATNQVVDAFGKSLRIGGATVMEATSATIQFAQAMASGKLAGDEFRSISEASPRFLKAIAEGSGIAAEKLKDMSSAGALTTEVIAKALVKEYHNLTKESESLGYTLEQGTNALKTGFMSLVGEFNEGAGITKYLGTLMADLGVSMIDGAKEAKQSGEAFKVWAMQNADNISTLVDAFKLLTTVIISRYVAAMILARVETMKTALGLLSLQIAAASAGRSFTLMTGAITLASTAMKGMLAFFGGWVGLALTVASTVAAYVLFNKESEKTTESLRKEGESIDDVVAKYKELSVVQQRGKLAEEQKNNEKLTESYKEQKQALIANVLNMSRHNDMTDSQAQLMSKLALRYKEGEITLKQLSNVVATSTILSKESKTQFDILAGSVGSAGDKSRESAKLVKELALATMGAGNEAEIAGSKFDKFLMDAKTQVETNKLALRYMKAFNLDQSKAIDLAKQDLALRSQGKYATIDHVKSLQELQKSEEDLTNETKSRNQAEKDLNKTRKDAEKDLKKFSNQVLEMTTYYDVLRQVNNMEVARIASQKEYISLYKDNLAVANELAEVQERIRQAESRIEYEKALRTEEEAHTRIVALMEQGADYDTAKAVAAAKFTDDMRGRQVAELTLTNMLYAQHQSLSDQVAQQENINKYLKDGLSLEQASLRVALSRIAALGDGKNDHEELRTRYELGLKLLANNKAIGDSQVKINALNREASLLSTAIGLGYDRASVAATKLAASITGLLADQAMLQLKKQEEVALLNEQIANTLKLSALLSGESETLRDIKSTYVTITNEEAKRLEQSRKALDIIQAYNDKVKEQKKTPFGDFSSVDFDVFGNMGNPFKEALDGLNAYLSGMTSLDEKIKTIQESMRQYQAEAEMASLSGQTQRSKELLDLANQQLSVEKDLQKQKAETVEIAYGQGLKFAKSFFKEESKGYKLISALEMALQAKKIAFAIWEKKDTISMMALELKGMLSSTATFLSTTATKLAAQMGFNVAKGTEAVLTQGSGDPYTAFPRMAAMAAVVAALGVAIGSVSGGSTGSFTAANNGTGTVFGDSEAQSASIANSIDLLSENSDLMLPLTSAMLRSLRNIESNIGGVTNLIVRQATGQGFNVTEGFAQNGIGSFLEKSAKTLFGGLDFLGIGKAIGGVLGSLFGSKTTIKGQGLFGGAQSLSDIMSGGFSLQEYIDVQTKKKTFGITTSTKNKTMFSAANKELENQFTLIFSGFYDSILTAANGLGANTDEVKTKLENAIINIGKIDLKGLNGEQIQERLEAVFGAAADSLAQQGFAGLDAFQRVGEGYYETLVRVASSVEQAAYYTDRLNVSAIKYTDIINKQGDVAAEIIRQSVLLVEGNKDIKGGFYDLVNTFEGTAEELSNFIFTLRDLKDQLVMTGKDADYLTSAMILGAGGLEGLSSGLDAYFEMLSPAEQAAELTRRLTNEFAIFGKELPADVKAFRNLVNGIDISTEAGQKLYGQIIALAPEFNDLQDALESANSETNALVQSLRDLAEQARAARGETEQPRNLGYLRNEFQKASELALMGDKEAAARLVSLGKDLMTMSKLYSVSGGDYAKDLAFIQGIASAVADMQEAGLGTSISPDLTPSTTTNTTPTLETTNSTMTTEMQTMREEFNAGLFAIAKYVQNLDSRTERWDDGDRAIVGIRQEADDAPIQVVVTP